MFLPSYRAPPVGGVTPKAATKRSNPSNASPAPAPQAAHHHPLLLALAAPASLEPRRVPNPSAAAGGGAPLQSNPNSFGPDSPATPLSNPGLPSPPPPSSVIFRILYWEYLWCFFGCLFQERVSSEDSRRLVRGIDFSHSRVLRFFCWFCWRLGFDLLVACF